MSAELVLVRSMKNLAAITLILAFALTALAAGETPPAEVFQQSAFQFNFKIPAAFKLTVANTGYFPTPMGSVPYEEKTWQNKADRIATKLTVMPDAWWQTRADGAFIEAKENMLQESGVRLISERDYFVGDCRAYSLVVGRKTEFQRIDFFLMKPDLRAVMYLSPKEAALNDAPCKTLFEGISLKPKTANDHN